MAEARMGKSRRDFLKDVALLGAGAAVTAMAGCAHSTESASAADGGRVIGYAGPGDWLGEPPQIAESDIKVVGDYDMVILGNGHSGVGAVFSAVDEGLKVAVVEQQPWGAFVDLEGTGANMGGWNGEDIGHVNSQFLIQRGYGPFNTGEILTEFAKRAGGRCMPDILKSFVQYSGPMFDRYKEIYDSYEADRKADDSKVFLTNTMVVIDGKPVPDKGEFDMSNMFDYPLCNTQAPHYEASYPINSGGYKTWPCNAQFYGYQGTNIEYVHKCIVKFAQDNGVEYFFEHTGIKLVTNASGAVTGLIAKDADGNYQQFNAKKGVLLASGDYIGNPQMCWALLNEGMEWAERAGAKADDWVVSANRAGAGHKMACWVGGMIEPSPRGWMALSSGVVGAWGMVPLLQLDVNGERFCNEASITQMYHINLRLASRGKAWVSDANWKQTIGRAPLEHGCPNYGIEDFWTTQEAQMDALVPGPEPNTIIGSFVAERKAMSAKVYCANSLSELADYLGYSGKAKDSFLDSIAHYNELCASDAGDTDYGKDKQYMVPISNPPYYGGTAADGPWGDMGADNSHNNRPWLVTLSGLITDKHQNVLNQDWKPIAGLYAAGNCLGNRFGPGYSTPFAGCSVGMAMTHGYTAAKEIAKG